MEHRAWDIMKKEVFHDKLKRLIHEYIMLTYKSTKLYPNDEKYGLQSQDRRAAVSVMLNYVEGYAKALTLGDEISAMLYSTLEGIREKLEK